MPVYKKVNKDFFKQWTQDTAYILGFFAADGYITVNKRGGQFWCFSITDGDLLEKIKKVIDSDHKITLRKGFGNEKSQYRIQIGSIEMCNDLRTLGFDVRKTKNLLVPNIPNLYFGSFIRGYFDGDGNVWSGLMNKGRRVQTLSIQTVFTSCSLLFLEGIRKKLEMFGVERGVIRKGTGDYYRLTYSVTNSLKLYDFMYNTLGTSNFFLSRKKEVFDRYIKMRP